VSETGAGPGGTQAPGERAPGEQAPGEWAPGERGRGEQAAWERSFAELWASLLPVGRTPAGYRRYSWTPADEACRAWFRAAAAARGLPVESDRNGNLWAWWRRPDAGGRAVAVGSHLDSVPDGGAFDGPLGVASAFAAIDLLRERGFAPARPVAVAAFTEEEGARFGVACLGSRLLAGAVEPAAAAGLRDGDGVSLAQAMAGAGLDPALLGPDDERLAGLAAYVELHIEQGSALDGLGAPVGLAAGIWPHGRWLLEFAGRADHAGTTRIADRYDPMLPFAATVLAARGAAVGRGALATFGKVIAEPGAANGISSAVRAWLDARAPDEATLDALITEVSAAARAAAAEHGVVLDLRRESFTPAVAFDPALRDRLAAVLAGPGPGRPEAGGAIPVLPTGAGHDAGILAARLPTAMLFVRNPTGVSHSPAEHADLADCLAGVAALAAVLADLAAR
jgi:beta-ureidopropionase / N-carbamoyl-L-amino-acid hydrolase